MVMPMNNNEPYDGEGDLNPTEELRRANAEMMEECSLLEQEVKRLWERYPRTTPLIDELRKRRATDRNNGRNSLQWIVPIAKTVLSRLTSDELEDFIVHWVDKHMTDVEKELLAGVVE